MSMKQSEKEEVEGFEKIFVLTSLMARGSDNFAANELSEDLQEVEGCTRRT